MEFTLTEWAMTLFYGWRCMVIVKEIYLLTLVIQIHILIDFIIIYM